MVYLTCEQLSINATTERDTLSYIWSNKSIRLIATASANQGFIPVFAGACVLPDLDLDLVSAPPQYTWRDIQHDTEEIHTFLHAYPYVSTVPCLRIYLYPSACMSFRIDIRSSVSPLRVMSPFCMSFRVCTHGKDIHVKRHTHGRTTYVRTWTNISLHRVIFSLCNQLRAIEQEQPTQSGQPKATD